MQRKEVSNPIPIKVHIVFKTSSITIMDFSSKYPVLLQGKFNQLKFKTNL